MAKVVVSGLIDGDYAGAIAPTYTLLDMEMKGLDEVDTLGQLFAYLDTYHIGPDASSSQSDNTMYINDMPSLWSEIGLPTKSQVGVITDVGLSISVSSLAGAYGPITFSDGRPVNAYSNTNAFTDGGLFISLSPTSADFSADYIVKTYNKGVHLKVEFNSRGILHVFFANTSEVFFFHSVNFAAPFGTVAKGSRNVVIRSFCERYKVYCLRSKISIAHGVVKDAVGGIAADCKVFMFRRTDGKLLGSAVSNSLGQYEMMTTALTGEQVFMVCLDNDVSPDFEGIIYDRILV